MNRLHQTRKLASIFGVSLIALHLAETAAHAQAFDQVAQSASAHVIAGWGYLLNMVCWIGGGLLLAISVFSWYQHQRNPNSGIRMGMVIAGLVCGGLLLTLPFLAKTATFTLFDQSPAVTGEQKQMLFDQ